MKIKDIYTYDELMMLLHELDDLGFDLASMPEGSTVADLVKKLNRLRP